MDFLSNENKYMLWSVLQESDVFQNIPNEKFNDVRNSFEKALLEFSKNNTPNNDIVIMNKEVIPILLSNVHTIANSSLGVKPSKKLELVYKADEPYRVEDIHKQRENDFNIKVQEKQNNMNELLQPKIPKEVSFADTKEDKPLGGEMDRLIKEMLTSRERELEVISASSQNVSDAKEWLKPSATKNTSPEQAQGVQGSLQEPESLPVNLEANKPTNNKFVSMETHPISEIVLETSVKNNNITPSFMDKLKKKDPIKEISEELKVLKEDQEKMMKKIDFIVDILEKKDEQLQEK